MPDKEKDPAEEILSGPVENFSRNIVDSNNEENARSADNKGLEAKIVRTTDGNCCPWCTEMAGEYDYSPNMDTDVFRRHDNCGCDVEYICEKGQQDVWSKKWRSDEKEKRNSRISQDKKTDEKLSEKDDEFRIKRIANDEKESTLPNADNSQIPENKISRFLLLPGAKHSEEFFSVGYTEQDIDQLRNDIMDQLSKNKATKLSGEFYGGRQRYSVIMTLGKTKKSKFVTIWQMIDGVPTLVTAHRI